jgi:hypothetical protein
MEEHLSPARSSKQNQRQKTLSQCQRERSEPRLILPPVTDPGATAKAVNKLIDAWVLPRLMQEYLREKGISPKTRLSPKFKY